jgi:hypothetical protein
MVKRPNILLFLQVDSTFSQFFNWSSKEAEEQQAGFLKPHENSIWLS